MIDRYFECQDEFQEGDCGSFDRGIYRFNATEIKAIKRVLVEKPELRELYDKQEIFIRQKYEKSPHNPSLGNRFLSTVSEVTNYAMYILMMTFYVEKHQNFAKQMTITSLLIFASLSVQLKMPREGPEENVVIEMVKQMVFLNKFTYFEINYLVKSIVYPNLYHSFLHMSRMVDVAPEIALRSRTQTTQRECSRTMIMCELITDTMDRAGKKAEKERQEQLKALEATELALDFEE